MPPRPGAPAPAGRVVALVLLLALAGLRPASAAEPAVARVILDRLTWAPDGSALAAEARFEAPDESATDTLVVDLTRGGLAARSLEPLLFAVDRTGSRLAVVGRYAVAVGPAASPESLAILAGRDPTRSLPLRLAFNAAGDSLLFLEQDRAGGLCELSTWSVAGGRQVVRFRAATLLTALRRWKEIDHPGEPLRITPSPFPHLYQPIGPYLFYLEPSTVGVPGVSSLWLFNLFVRDPKSGTARVLATQVAPWDQLVSPDSAWIAIVGTHALPDYGGRLESNLWIGSPDGTTFYSVTTEGGRGRAPATTLSLAWIEGRLWFTNADGLWILDPREGRARRCVTGAPPPAWSSTLRAPAPLWALLSRRSWSDTLSAVHEREERRRDGWPAWVALWEEHYRVAIGSAPSEAELGELQQRLTEAGETGWFAVRVDPASSGSPFPWAVAKSPTDPREAYLVASGPPGSTAGEIWLTERQGARQIRLVRAMRSAIGPSGP